MANRIQYIFVTHILLLKFSVMIVMCVLSMKWERIVSRGCLIDYRQYARTHFFFFCASSSSLLAQKGRWTHHEEKFLELGTLELVAGNLALQALIGTLERDGFTFQSRDAPAQRRWSLDLC